MAQTRGAPELSHAALDQAAALDSKAQELSAELAEIRRDIAQLKEALPLFKAKQRRVDPDQLLAELSMLVGLDKTAPDESQEPKLDEVAADNALAELKKKMGLP